MTKKTTTLFVWFICIALFISIAITDTISAAVLTHLDIDTVKELTLSHNRTLKSMQIAVDSSKTNKKITKDTYENKNASNTWRNQLDQLRYLEDKIAADPGNTVLIANKAALEANIAVTKAMMGTSENEQIKDAYTEAQDAYEDAITAKNESEESLLYQVEKVYTSILTTESQQKVLQKTSQVKNMNLRIERLREELGMASEADVDKAIVEASNTGQNVSSINDSLLLLKWTINDMMGRDMKTALSLTEFDVVIDTIPTYDYVVQKAFDNSSNLKKQKRDLKQRKDDLYDDDVKDDSDKTDLVEKDIEGKEISITDTEINLKSKVKEYLDKLMSTKNAYELEKISFNNAQREMDWAKNKYDLGMISKIQLYGYELSYLDAESQLISAKYEYYHAKRAVELIEKGIIANISGGGF